MNKMKKTFPNNKNIILLLTFILICCSPASKNIMDEEVFINTYANLLIINELKIQKNKKASMISVVLKENDTTMDEINDTIASYKQQPENWVSVLQKVRDHIRVLKTKDDTLQANDSSAVN